VLAYDKSFLLSSDFLKKKNRFASICINSRESNQVVTPACESASEKGTGTGRGTKKGTGIGTEKGVGRK
jgi:hypothetical protein